MIAEITAVISSQYAMQDLIEIGDALLAAPILAVEVMLDSANAYIAINELRNRAGNHMTVAARNIQTLEQATRAIEADAQYLVCASLGTAMHIQVTLAGQLPNIVCIPTIYEWNSISPNIQSFSQVKFSPLGPVTASQVQSLCNLLPHTQIILDLPGLVHSEITHRINEFVQAGAAGISVGQAIVTNSAPTMADIITNARMLTSAWKTAVCHLQP